MARKDENKQPKAQWNEAEVDALLDYLITQKSKIAGTTFKDEVFNEASNMIAGMGTYGPSKTGPQCKTKWASCLTIFMQVLFVAPRSPADRPHPQPNTIPGARPAYSAPSTSTTPIALDTCTTAAGAASAQPRPLPWWARLQDLIFSTPIHFIYQAGLFSAANTAFIIAMQPNAVDTTITHPRPYLKQTHNAIERYCNNRSGCHWDNVNGANIQGEAAEVQWGQFLSASVANKAMRFFKNTGWRFWPKMLEILPNGSGAEGAAAYNPALLAAQESAPAASASAEASGSVLPTQASAPAASASAEASGSVIPTTHAEASGEAMGLAIGVPGARNAGGVPSARTAASPGFEWDQIMSALPSTDPGMVARASTNIPPPPSSIAYTHSSTGKRSHSDMVLSSTTTQTSVSQVNSPSLDKKPKLSTRGGSSMSRVTSQRTGTKATKDTANNAANTAAFMNLQGSINRLTDSLETSMTKTDDGRVADECTQALDMMQDDERISPSDKVTLMNVFARSPAVSSTYLVSRPENCIPYLESVLRQAANGVYGAL
ncbi:hypothetical protein DEU56DRAFT_941592 [Suillus clintonianus]|uniref:uncharacterized protein n=1 Tax=Suillus clintonianus TaxID=1904413 RepID=UPI001B869DD2|nr:uncharacterized protein DEU56DRAFT_941592 [Suillus clintonianus]KAG2140622.1 hypothetical protein DEU56DRAFT_941592 [Suillus clintonianus]